MTPLNLYKFLRSVEYLLSNIDRKKQSVDSADHQNRSECRGCL